MATTTATRGRTGDMLPEISLPLLDGGDLDFSSLRGKKLLLFFWGSW
jgi:peroxiredoxin